MPRWCCCIGSLIPQQAWGPTYRNAKRNPRAPPAEAPQVKRLKANREITAPEVRLVGTDGTHQVMPLAEALRAARNAKLDLVQVAGIACCCQMVVIAPSLPPPIFAKGLCQQNFECSNIS